MPATSPTRIGRIESEADADDVARRGPAAARPARRRPAARRPSRSTSAALLVDAVSDAHAAGPDHAWAARPARGARRGRPATRAPAAPGRRQPAGQRPHAHPSRARPCDRRLAREGDRVRLAGRRRRPGHPDRVAAGHVFERFARGDASRTRADGQHRPRPVDRGRRRGRPTAGPSRCTSRRATRRSPSCCPRPPEPPRPPDPRRGTGQVLARARWAAAFTRL